MKTRRFTYWLETGWLFLLAVYVLAGVSITPFHGDEAMQITMSRDYFTVFSNGQPGALMVNPPYAVDSDPWLRLINGSINRYGIGLSLQLAGYDVGDLPSLWQWPLSVEDNLARGSGPTQAVLNISRISSALFLAASVPLLFVIGWQISGRPVAFLTSGLYAFHPVILLNGRRAMMEGSLLCFGLLTILLAAFICQSHRGWRWWVALGTASGLALASKHSGIVFVAGAWGWIVVYSLSKERLGSSLWAKVAPKRDDTQVVPYENPPLPQNNQFSWAMRAVLPRITVTSTVTALVFVALSPALWNDPIARFGDLVSERQKLLESQVVADPNGATTLSQRIEGILTQPFMQPPTYYEAAFWGSSELVQAETTGYTASPWSGVQWGVMAGAALTILAGFGIAVTIGQGRTVQRGLVVWLGVTVISLLLNPLPWQRYYLPLLPIAALLAATGAKLLYDRVQDLRSST